MSRPISVATEALDKTGRGLEEALAAFRHLAIFLGEDPAAATTDNLLGLFLITSRSYRCVPQAI